MKYFRSRFNSRITLVFIGQIVFILFMLGPQSSIVAREGMAQPEPLGSPNQPRQAHLIENYGRLPLSFEVNEGQTNSQVKYLSRGQDYSLFLTGTEAVLKLGKPSTTGSPLLGLRQLQFDNRIDNKILLNIDSLRPASPAPTSIPQPIAHAALRMRLAGADAAAKVSGLEQLPGKVNYFRGNDPKKWRTNVPTYAKVKYAKVYPGIDLVYYGDHRHLEYDFVVAPDADPRSIVIAFDGDGLQRVGNRTALRIDNSGNLVIRSDGGEVQFHKPVIYQEASGLARGTPRSHVDGNYVLLSDNRVGFEVGSYDLHQPLIIDPILSYSTYLGGSFWDEAVNLATDDAGNAYVVGITYSADFPTTSGAYDTACGTDGSCDTSVSGDSFADVFVTKLGPTGTVVYSTYLGGGNEDWGTGIAADLKGNAYVTGWTLSNDFPTLRAIQPEFSQSPSDCFVPSWGMPCGDAFVTKINSTGSALVYSTYLGGSGGDYGLGIAVDPVGNSYVTGFTNSPDFPLQKAFQNSFGSYSFDYTDSFVTKLDPKGTAMVYSTYLGGGYDDEGDGIAVDFFGNAYVVGYSCSNDFPVANAIQPDNLGACVATVTKISPKGSRLVYSTYLGGSGGSGGLDVAVDYFGNAYVTGGAGPDFPTTPGAFQENVSATPWDAFVTKLNAAGSKLVYSTYLGGNGNERGDAIALDFAGNAYVTGKTASTDFPTAKPIQAANAGGFDAFVTALNPTGTRLWFSTYLGGNAEDWGRGLGLDGRGNIYVAGRTRSSNFPLVHPIRNNLGGHADAFVAKISPRNTP